MASFLRAESSVIEEKAEKFFTSQAQLHLPFAFSQRSTSSQSPAGPLAITAIFCFGSAGVFLSSYLQPVVKNCKHVIGSHAPIIDWAETAQFEEHDIMFTCDIEALYPSIQVWPGVGLCLFDVVERAIRRFYSLEQDLVEFLVRLLRLVLSTQLTQYGGSFFEVTWGLSTGLQQVSWPICIWMCWTLTCGRAQRVLSSVSSGTLMTVLECWIRGTSQSTSCSVC